MASVLICSTGQAQVDLVVGDGSGSVTIEVGSGQQIPLWLDSTGVVTLGAANLVVTADDLLDIPVAYDSIGSIFGAAGFSIVTDPIPPQDLNVGIFAEGVVDGTNGLDLFGTLSLDSSLLSPGTSFTLDFAGTFLADLMGMPVQSLPSPITVLVGTPPLLGDFDIDGDVDADDIDFYGGNIGMAADGELEQLDLDGDGMVTLSDHNMHVMQYVQTTNGGTGTFLGDLNLDGTVDVLGDAFILIAGLGSVGAGWADGDLNADFSVNVLGDAFVLIANLGSGS